MAKYIDLGRTKEHDIYLDVESNGNKAHPWKLVVAHVDDGIVVSLDLDRHKVAKIAVAINNYLEEYHKNQFLIRE